MMLIYQRDGVRPRRGRIEKTGGDLMLRRLLIAALLVGLMSPVWAEVTSIEGPYPALDGMTFKIKVTPDESARQSGERSFRDRLVFSDGKMSVTERESLGFKPGWYETHETSGGMGFAATLTSAAHGTSVWSGTLEGK